MEWSQGGKFIKLGGDQGGSNSYGTIFQRSEKVIKKYAQILHDLIVKVSYQYFPNKKKLHCIVLYCIVLSCNILAQDIAGSC